MLQATLMGGDDDGQIPPQHVHVSSLRPDRIIRTGVIEPYPLQKFNPTKVAQAILQPFVHSVVGPGPAGPSIGVEPPPETIVAMARDLAVAMKAGIRPRAGVAPQLLRAARNIAEGRAFTIKARGRELLVKPTRDVAQLGAPPTLLQNPKPDLATRRAMGAIKGPGYDKIRRRSQMPGMRQYTERDPYFLPRFQRGRMGHTW